MSIFKKLIALIVILIATSVFIVFFPIIFNHGEEVKGNSMLAQNKILSNPALYNETLECLIEDLKPHKIDDKNAVLGASLEYYKQGEYAYSIILLNLMIQADPNNYHNYVNKAKALNHLGKHDHADREYDNAIKILQDKCSK